MMPEAQQPVPSNFVKEISTTDLKVYFKLEPSDDWEIDKSLVCLGHSKTKGSKIGSAQFAVLTFNNDFITADWQDANAAMRYNAAVKYNCDLSKKYTTPYLVKVTDVYSGKETAVWYGYISNVDQDFKGEGVMVNGLTYAGLMDQQQILGGWYLNNGGTVVDYYRDHKPVYNPKGIGNRSDKVLATTSSIVDIYGIDKTLQKDTKTTANLWTAKHMLDQVIGRGVSTLFNDAGNNYNPWIWFKSLYDAPIPIEYSKAVGEILASSPPVSDYMLHGKSLWQALVEIVESIDGLTISEEIYPKSGDVYLVIVNLKAA